MEKLLYGHQVTVDSPSKLELTISGKIVLDEQYTLSGVLPVITKVIQTYITDVQKQWFKSEEVYIYIAKIIAAILSVEGVVNVENIKINNSTEDLIINPNDTNNPYPVLKEVVLVES